MSFFSTLLAKLRGTAETSEAPSAIGKAAEQLDEIRGDNISTLPAEDKPTSSENVAAAARDSGMGTFSRGAEEFGSAADGYRPSK